MKKITNNINIKALLALPVLVMFMFASCELKAQDTIYSNEEEEIEEFELICYVGINPEFPGGNDSLNAFIKRNLQYPKSAKEQGIEGTVFVRFVVETDGSVTVFRINQDVNEELAAEAIRLVNMLPKWKPGYLGPTPVRVGYTLPIVFKLDKE